VSEPTTEQCLACRFWSETVKDGVGIQTGQCQRRSPVPFFEDDADGGVLHWGRWPITEDTDWCGDFERLAAAPPPPAPN